MGGPTRKRPQEMNREQENLALGKMTPGKRKGMKGSATKTPKSKDLRGNQKGKVTDIRMFFEAKVGSSTSNQEIGSKEERRAGSNEPDLEIKSGNR